MTSPRLPLALRVLAWRVRPLALVLALVAACALAARAAAPPPAPTVPVVVAAADLDAGHTLTADDLRTARVPRSAAPSSAASRPDALVGEELAADVPRGLAVVTTQLARSRFVTTAPAGTVAVPVHLADAAVAALLRPGDRVDLVTGTADGWPGEQGPAVLAESALVLEVVAETEPEPTGLLGAGAGTDADPLVVVAVPAQEGHLIAAAAGGSLGAVLVGGS